MSSAPRISNPPQPKLDNLPSFLLDPSFASLIDQIAGNRSFSGRHPLKPPELHSAVELLPPVPVLFAQQLKSTLGEPLVLMLSTFLRVRDVSTLVLDHAAVGRTVPPPPYAAGSASAALPPHLRAHRSRPAALVLSPRHPAAAWPRRRRPEPRRRRLCVAPPLGSAGADRHAAWLHARGSHGAAAGAPPRGTPPAAAAGGPWPALGAPPHAAPCVAEQGKKPLPLTSGARWSVG